VPAESGQLDDIISRT